MFDYTYGIRTLAEYLDRARSEIAHIERLQDEVLPDERAHEVRSAATQAAVTIWHLSDFVFGAPDADAARVRARLGGKDLRDFQTRLRTGRPSIELCWELANGGKHFHKNARAAIEEATVSAGAAVTVVAVMGSPNEPQPQQRPAMTRRPKIIFPAGRRLRASDVFRSAIAEWEALLS